MSWQQPCTSPTTHAGVQAISVCDWSKIIMQRCVGYGSADVHVVVPTNVNLKVISLKVLFFKAKTNTTHVALNALRREVEEMQQFLVLQDVGYVRHCKENAPIYMYALLRSTGNAYDVTSYRRLSRPHAPQIFWTSLLLRQ